MSRRLRVLALVPPDPRGECASRYPFLAEELDGLAARGVEIHVVSPYLSSGRLVGRCNGHPVPRWRNARGTAVSLRELATTGRRDWMRGTGLLERLAMARTHASIARVARERAVDMIYSPFLWPFSLAGLPIGEALRIPLVVSVRGVDVLAIPEIGYGRTCDEVLRHRTAAVLRAAGHTIGVSRALVDRAVELGADPLKTSVILKGVDTGRFRPGDRSTARARIGVPDRPTILYVGGLVPCKGVSALMPAVGSIRRTVPDAQLLVCGDGPLLPQLRDEAVREGVDRCVTFAGRIGRSEIVDYFNACDVLVLPSLSEGSGNVLVEAGACAKPVVGADVDGIPDYIDDGVTGFLFEPGDSDDLAAKAAAILAAPSLASRLGEAGRVRVERWHDQDRILNRLIEVLEGAASRRNENATEVATYESLPAGC